MRAAASCRAIACATVTNDTRYALDLQSELLDARRDAGLVRECHGDLHLRNIVLIDGRPTLFDAIEFNDEIACIDVLYDLAFLLMDLWRRRLPEHANQVWNAYLAETVDLDGLPLLPLFLSCRAAVRAKTSAAAARLQADAARRAGHGSTGARLPRHGGETAAVIAPVPDRRRRIFGIRQIVTGPGARAVARQRPGRGRDPQ